MFHKNIFLNQTPELYDRYHKETKKTKTNRKKNAYWNFLISDWSYVRSDVLLLFYFWNYVSTGTKPAFQRSAFISIYTVINCVFLFIRLRWNTMMKLIFSCVPILCKSYLSDKNNPLNIKSALWNESCSRYVEKITPITTFRFLDSLAKFYNIS